MAGKTSLRRHQAALSAISFIEAHVDEIVAGAEQRFLPLLGEGRELPDLRTTLQLVNQLMGEGLDEVIRADREHLDERDGDLGPRLELIDAAEDVQQQLVAARRIAAGVYGTARAKEILAIDGDTANVTQPLLLVRQGRDTVLRLRNDAIPVPTVKIDGVQFDPKVFADRLEPAVDRLETVHKAVHLERRKIESTVDAKAETTETFDSLFRACVRLAVSLCLIGDNGRLAARLNAKLLNAPRRGTASEQEAPPSPAEEVPASADDTPPSPDADTGTEEAEAT